VLGEANSIQGLGDIALERSDLEGAQSCYEKALPLYRRVGSVLGEANCIQSLGDIALARSDHEAARARHDEVRHLYQRIKEPYSTGIAHRRLARIASREHLCQLHVNVARVAPTDMDRKDPVAQMDREPAVVDDLPKPARDSARPAVRNTRSREPVNRHHSRR
jgi:tetratricopeptide (TPR) repeat protein